MKERCNSLYSALFTEIEILESDLKELELALDKIDNRGKEWASEGDIYEEFMTEKINLEYGEGIK